MVPYWQPDRYYNHGDVVEFEGAEYKIIEPHCSQGDLTPPVAPAFWERLRSGGRRHNREEKSGRGRRPLQGPPDYGQQQQQVQRVEVNEVSQHRPRSRLDGRDEQQGGECKPQCPPDYGQKEQQIRRIDVEEILQRPRHDREEQWSEDFKPHCLPDRGQKEQQIQHVDVEEVSQRPRHDCEEQWGEDFKPQCLPDHGQKEQQTRRIEVEDVPQRPCHDHEEQWGEGFKPQCPPGYEQKEQQTLRIDSGYEHVTSQELDISGAQQEHWEEETGKRWYDIDDKRKLGGGILAGAAALGAGFLAYSHFRNSTEKKATQTWSANAWIAESQTRTQQWRAGRYNAPIAWIWNEGKSIPRDAIRGGEERGEIIYICRVYHQGGIMVGKASSFFKKGAVIGYKKDETHHDKYEILVGDPRAVRWVTCSGKFDLEALYGARPVEGGREPRGSPIYIAQAPYRGAVYPGKACEVYGDGCFIPYDDTEKKVKEYAVLCYA